MRLPEFEVKSRLEMRRTLVRRVSNADFNEEIGQTLAAWANDVLKLTGHLLKRVSPNLLIYFFHSFAFYIPLFYARETFRRHTDNRSFYVSHFFAGAIKVVREAYEYRGRVFGYQFLKFIKILFLFSKSEVVLMSSNVLSTSLFSYAARFRPGSFFWEECQKT